MGQSLVVVAPSLKVEIKLPSVCLISVRATRLLVLLVLLTTGSHRCSDSNYHESNESPRSPTLLILNNLDPLIPFCPINTMAVTITSSPPTVRLPFFLMSDLFATFTPLSCCLPTGTCPCAVHAGPFFVTVFS